MGVHGLYAQEEDPELGGLSPEEILGAVSTSGRVDESIIFLGEVPEAQGPGGEPTGFVIFRMVLVLALAALAIYGIVFFIKRAARPQELRDPYLKVLARIPLSNDSYAAVISLGAKAWLVGGSQGGVNLISEIDDEEALQSMLIDEANREIEIPRFPDFRSLLSKINPSLRRRSPSPAAAGFNTDFLRKQRERLGGL